MFAFLLTWLNLTEIKGNHKSLHTGDGNCFVSELFLHKLQSELAYFDDQIMFLSNSAFSQLCMFCRLIFVFLLTLEFHRKKMKFCLKKE